MSFDQNSQNYLLSSDHRLSKGDKHNDDLVYVQEYFEGASFGTLLDVGTGAGHFIKIFNAKIKYGIDASFNMLKQSRVNQFGNICINADAAKLPFKSNAFDIVICRLVLHHLGNSETLFHEVSRVIKENGIFVLIDTVTDVDDSYLNVIEFLRENSHKRVYTIKEIISFSSDDFRLVHYNQIFRKHDFNEWVKRGGASEREIERVKRAFIGLPEHIKEDLKVEASEEDVFYYTDKKGVFIFKAMQKEHGMC